MCSDPCYGVSTSADRDSAGWGVPPSRVAHPSPPLAEWLGVLQVEQPVPPVILNQSTIASASFLKCRHSELRLR